MVTALLLVLVLTYFQGSRGLFLVEFPEASITQVTYMKLPHTQVRQSVIGS